MSVEPATNVTRRALLRATGVAGAGAVAAACAPAAAPAPAAPVPAAKAAWEKEWEDLVVAAKKEGKVAVITNTGVSYRKGLDAFQAAFPGIEVEHQAFTSASLIAPKVLQERKGNVYSVDVAQFAPALMIRLLRPEGVFDPIRPVIFRPDVLDDNAWFNGYERGFVDLDRKLAFAHEHQVNRAFWVNGDLVKDGEIKTVKDLLDPKWKGKIFMADVRSGDGYLPMTGIKEALGEGALKQIIVDQEAVFSRERRQIIEAVVRGRYPIGMALFDAILPEFQEQGLGKNVKPLVLPEADYIPAEGVLLFNKAPHPNAAKLFINWFLTKEGQTAVNAGLKRNSRRKDVPIQDPATAPGTAKYLESSREENYAKIDAVRAVIEKLAGVTN